MSSRAQSQQLAVQRFFDFVFHVPGDCFCCNWSIACFLETVEHMDGDKRWRNICTLGMSVMTLSILFLLSLSLCPIFYWSVITESISVNYTIANNTQNLSYQIDNYITTDQPNLTEKSREVGRITMYINLWYIKYCRENYTNDSYDNTAKILFNSDELKQIDHQYKMTQNNYNADIRNSQSTSIHSDSTVNQTVCHNEPFQSKAPSANAARQLSLVFIILVTTLLMISLGCIISTHPWFDKYNRNEDDKRKWTTKLIALSITLLCACVLNWSSFVFERIITNDLDHYNNETPYFLKVISRNNLDTGMLAINGSMLMGIILAVVHCGAPTRYGPTERRRQRQSRRRRVLLSQAHIREQNEHDRDILDIDGVLNYSEIAINEENNRSQAPLSPATPVPVSASVSISAAVLPVSEERKTNDEIENPSDEGQFVNVTNIDRQALLHKYDQDQETKIAQPDIIDDSDEAVHIEFTNYQPIGDRGNKKLADLPTKENETHTTRSTLLAKINVNKPLQWLHPNKRKHSDETRHSLLVDELNTGDKHDHNHLNEPNIQSGCADEINPK